MGIDACIYFKAKQGFSENSNRWALPNGYSIIPASRFAVDSATHEVDNLGRFYSPNYPRGRWPELSSVLMILLQNKDIEKVWYCGDTFDEWRDNPFTLKRLIEYTEYFVMNG